MITVGKVSGVVQDITLAATVLTGEDGERITIPNKEIVGQVIVNSKDSRIVEYRLRRRRKRRRNPGWVLLRRRF